MAKINKEQQLRNLIDEAGRVNSQISALRKKYDSLRAQLEIAMPFPADGQNTVVEAGEFEAALEYKFQTYVSPQRLMEMDAQVFWGIVKVPVGEAEKMLTPDVFHYVSEKRPGDLPVLTVRQRRHEQLDVEAKKAA